MGMPRETMSPESLFDQGKIVTGLGQIEGDGGPEPVGQDCERIVYNVPG